MQTGQLITFVVTASIIIAIPGPSVLFIVSRSLVHGRRAGVATVAGNTIGFCLQVVAVALGLGPIVERSILLFTVIKLGGALYLVWLGVEAIRHRRALRLAFAASTRDTRPTGHAIRDGAVVGFANPKSIVFLAAILPQFVATSMGHILLQLVVLGLIFTVIATAYNVVLVAVADRARHWCGRSPRKLDAIGGFGGLMMVGLGVRLALTQQQD